MANININALATSQRIGWTGSGGFTRTGDGAFSALATDGTTGATVTLGSVVAADAGSYSFSTRGKLDATADGVFRLRNAADSAMGDLSAKQLTIPTSTNGGALYLDGGTTARIYCDNNGVGIYGGPAFSDPYTYACFGVRAQNSITCFNAAIGRVALATSTNFGIVWATSADPRASFTKAQILYDADDMLSCRRDTNAQQWNVYNTWTSTTNYERLAIDWKTTANTCIIEAQKGSAGGTLRPLLIRGESVDIGPTGKGARSTAVGSGAMQSVTANDCTAIGYEALKNGSGTSNVAIGTWAATTSTAGTQSVAIGVNANRYSAINQAVVIGGQACYTGNGTFSVVIGAYAGYNCGTTTHSVFLGHVAGRYVSGGTDNTSATQSILIGYDTRPNAAGESNQIVIGDQAIGLGSNTTVLGNSSTTNTKIFGDWTIVDGKNLILDTTTGTKIGTATGQKLGFWNSTPVVQQVLATGASNTVDDVITFLQTIGLCKQS